ncbi:adenylate isopentenyltransferase-like [Gastrolobium bilobum]|uniref:adenylate isopentenyltransferase-like n=1 Tax=Gastrolobium bilobum TaxID=150636 RepID=UPI002AAF2E57|nr:adenylate isopentenyltransferase-like [Gastrolobium bilobum]
MRLPFFSTNTHHYSFPLFATGIVHRPRWPRMNAALSFRRRHRRKDKVVVIMGATGTGKSRLSVDLATLFFPFFEIVNSDKMQVYNGLDITTNKIPIEERNGVPHHLLGKFDPKNGELTPLEFRRIAGEVVADITSRRKLPIVVGGSNSFIHALLVERFDPELNVFDETSLTIVPELTQFRYECCFLWVDVSFPVLSDYLLKRVDDMLDSGMVDELAEFFDPETGDLEVDSASPSGLRKAIGVAEFDRYLKEYPPPLGFRGCWEKEGENRMRNGAYEGAVRAIKDKTCHLAKRQIGKILRLKRAGWDLRRLDATAALSDGGRRSEIWEREVLEPSVKIVKLFMKE